MANPASNTKEVFQEFIGQELIGYISGPLRPSGSYERHTLIFQDGRGIGIAEGGGYWIVSAKDAYAAVNRLQLELGKVKEEHERIVAMATALPPLPTKTKPTKKEKK